MMTHRGLYRGNEVTSQNRMNAWAEYVLYRIWAALQDQKGIHAESLFTCLGAVASQLDPPAYTTPLQKTLFPERAR
jgi:hypothetical protein